MQSAFLDNISPGTVGYANESGWMCQPQFVKYIRHFIKFVKPSIEHPVLLLLDNHVSHMSVEALDIAAANGVHILSFPPHCSHRLQPLDVSVFSPVKNYYKSQCSAWQKNNANKVRKQIMIYVMIDVLVFVFFSTGFGNSSHCWTCLRYIGYGFSAKNN